MQKRRPVRPARHPIPAEVPEVADRAAAPAKPPEPPQPETEEEAAARRMFEAAYT